ncbi:hypothetical protein LHJ74_19540 [Streptomyces sp. N2-109]|uniref:Uncharacterized protein n=1 Tax=Streptomyces gossypii TaxID=2883101 RepID=A0ABT2JWL4_9ACTN|nr:hypothetical protein [Streptomyces gossypii]MCT2592068.1 hypothetical protein [Streptomyces gossypii]
MSEEEPKLPYKPQVREVEAGKSVTRKISSELLDMAGIKGKVTDSGPGIAVCEDVDPNFREYYIVRHPWSIYGISNRALEQGMQNFRKGLPGHGWTITKDGPARSRNEDPEIFAENKGEKHAVHIIWHRTGANRKPLIHVNLVSECYKRSIRGGEQH